MPAVNWTNVTDISQIPAQANYVSGGIFWISMLWMIFFVLFIALVPFGIYPALASVSLVTFTLGVLLLYSDLISFSQLMVFVGIDLIIIMILAYLNGKR